MTLRGSRLTENIVRWMIRCRPHHRFVAPAIRAVSGCTNPLLERGVTAEEGSSCNLNLMASGWMEKRAILPSASFNKQISLARLNSILLAAPRFDLWMPSIGLYLSRLRADCMLTLAWDKVCGVRADRRAHSMLPCLLARYFT